MSDDADPASNDAGNKGSVEARFASLEDASRRLSADVQGLNAALSVVNELRRRQQELGRRAEEATAASATAVQESIERDVRTRRVIQLVTLAMAVLLPVVSILVYVALIQHVDQLLTEQRASSYSGCTTRNAATLSNADRESLLAQYETNPKLVTIHRDSEKALRTSVVDCSKYLKPVR